MIEANSRAVRQRIAEALRRAGREGEEVLLVAVTKEVSISAIRQVLAAGIQHLGENRVQEARAKVEAVGPGPVWHMVGHLQRNKARDALHLFRWIESIDSLALAEALARRWTGTEGTSLLLQVNTTGEASKHGVRPEEVLPLIEKMSAIERLILRGLMTIGPLTDDRALMRRAFRTLRELSERVQREAFPHAPLGHLSMGMSGDFEVAIEEGSTLVRIGTAIFGPRPGRAGQEVGR